MPPDAPAQDMEKKKRKPAEQIDPVKVPRLDNALGAGVGKNLNSGKHVKVKDLKDMAKRLNYPGVLPDNKVSLATLVEQLLTVCSIAPKRQPPNCP